MDTTFIPYKEPENIVTVLLNKINNLVKMIGFKSYSLSGISNDTSDICIPDASTLNVLKGVYLTSLFRRCSVSDQKTAELINKNEVIFLALSHAVQLAEKYFPDAEFVLSYESDVRHILFQILITPPESDNIQEKEIFKIVKENFCKYTTMIDEYNSKYSDLSRYFSFMIDYV